MTAKATRKPPTPQSSVPIESLQRFTPEQAYELELMPYKPDTFRKKAQLRQVYHHRDGGRITVTREDLRRNAELGQAAPLAIGA